MTRTEGEGLLQQKKHTDVVVNQIICQTPKGGVASNRLVGQVKVGQGANMVKKKRNEWVVYVIFFIWGCQPCVAQRTQEWRDPRVCLGTSTRRICGVLSLQNSCGY